MEVQLQVFAKTAGPHKNRDAGVRIAAVHRRLDDLESSLRRRAQALGQDSTVRISELQRRLARYIERRRGAGVYDGPERRRRQRRRLAVLAA